MNTTDKKPASKNTAGIAIVALLLGVLIGVVGMKYLPGHLKNAQTPPTPLAASGTSPEGAPPPPIAAGPSSSRSPTPADWDPFQEMRDMQADMDRIFQRSVDRLRSQPEFIGFKGDSGYSLNLDVGDRKDHFEVRASLPDAKASDVNVNLENDRTLKVEVNHKETEKSAAGSEPSTVTEWGRYEQRIQLPAPVKADQMKVDRKDHELLITIPKK